MTKRRRVPWKTACGLRAAALLIALGSGLGHTGFSYAQTSAASNGVGGNYLVAGPAIVRLTAGVTLAVATPAFDPNGSAQPLAWAPVLSLEETEQTAGWRIVQLVCDAGRPNLCVVERARTGSAEWRVVDLARRSPISPWTTAEPGRIMDFEAAGPSILLGQDEARPQASIILTPLVPGIEGPRSIWRSTAGADNAFARFIRAGDDRPRVLLMEGGDAVNWSVISTQGIRSASHTAPGRLSAILGTALYFSASDASGTHTAFGYVQAPADGIWGRDQSLYTARSPETPALAINRRGSLLWDVAQATAFAPSGAAFALVRDDLNLSLSEICRKPNIALPVAERVEDASAWLAGAQDAALYGGAPFGRTLLLARTGVAGQTELVGLVDTSPIDGSAEALRPCGQTRLRRVDLPAPPLRPGLANVKLERHQVDADDGAKIDYAVIGDPTRRGRILVRPYGAYGQTPQAYLAHPFERDWVSLGNTLVVPRLRGDEGTADWVGGGQGDYKSRSTQDLIAVVEDLRRDHPTAGRIDLVGMSAGAFVAAKAALLRPELFERVTLISGALDLTELEGAGVQREFGPAVDGFPAWYGAKPAGTDAKPYFLIIHGSADAVTPLSNATNFAAYVRGLGYELKGQAFEGVGHELASRGDVAETITELSQQIRGVH